MIANQAGASLSPSPGWAWTRRERAPRALLRACRVTAGSARRIAAARRALAARTPTPDAARELRSRAFAFSRLCGELCAVHRFRVVVSGPVPAGPVVLVSNHLGYIDPIVLAATVPCIPIAKRELSRWPLIGSVGREHGVVFVERGSVQSGARALRSAWRAIGSGLSVLNFPEGTTTHGDAVLPFRRGIFGLARRGGVPVVPIGLSFDDRELHWVGSELFLPHYLRLAGRCEAVVRVRFGCAMTPVRYGSAADLAREARDVVDHLRGAI
jgi:1-acyl-sn-glycerol-3-phosphate acyltransferase